MERTAKEDQMAKGDGKVRRITIPPAMDAALESRAAKNGVSVHDYIIAAVHDAMDRDMFAEVEADAHANRAIADANVDLRAFLLAPDSEVDLYAGS